jgi:HD-GYP domain-containing protein (c-di-GMP phosphodiesterase class II)
MSTSKPSRALRKKGKTSESVNPPLDNHVKLAYNILKNLEDDIVSEKEIPIILYRLPSVVSRKKV